jgi:GNAT superfamily N-acetyltransferase
VREKTSTGDDPKGHEALEVRQARPEDREGVLAFCASTFSWGDYVETFWDAWLNDPDGRCLVGLWGGRPVAVGRTYFPAPGEAWLEGMRVDPTLRGRGFARAIHGAAVRTSIELGARQIRYDMPFAQSEASRHLGQTDGFRVVGAYTPWEGPARQAGSIWRRVHAAEATALAPLLAGPGWVSTVPGLISTHFRYHRASAAALAGRASKGELWLRGDGAEPDALALLDEGEGGDRLTAEWVHARAESLASAPAALAALAGQLGRTRTLVWVPDMAEAKRVYGAAGYREGALGPYGGAWSYPLCLLELILSSSD